MVNPRLAQWMLLLGVVSLSAFLLSATSYLSQKSTYVGKPGGIRDTFTVNGHGEMTAIPDLAILNAGLETTAKTPSEAQKENTEKMNNFLAKVKTLGIEEKDRKTIEYSIYPKYEYIRELNGADKQQITGYTVRNQVELKIRKLDSLSNVFALFGEHGLNQVGSLTFTIDDDKALKQQALEKALDEAKIKAQSIARTAGFRLGTIVSFSEQGAYPPMPYAAYGMGGEAAYDMKSVQIAPTTERGSTMINSDVMVTYQILP